MTKHIHSTTLDSGHEAEITYAYYPEERRVDYYADGSGYPGASASCEVLSIEVDGKDTDVSSKELERLENECLEWHDEEV
jgi:hypothetical protein